MAELSLHQTVERNERLKAFLLLEHELVNCHGPRNTKWEMVVNHLTKRKVYMNVDTMQSIHRNSAICERCDHVLQQSDEKCHGCEAKRSSKNGKLFRPIGYQNICVNWHSQIVFKCSSFNKNYKHVINEMFWGNDNKIYFKVNLLKSETINYLALKINW